jgi:GntR family transcriptional repressor for pyruvate dehydrogenase complex
MNGKQSAKESLPEKIAADIRRKIRSGALQVGDRLPGHRELATEYSVSVSSVREALTMLTSTGLVEAHVGRGTFVVEEDCVTQLHEPVERHEVEELLEARQALELQLVVLAAERATSADINHMWRAFEQLEKAVRSPAAYAQADRQFHLAIAKAARNQYLLRAFAEIRRLMKPDIELSAQAAVQRFGDLRSGVEAHRGLAEAIAAHDPRLASQALAEIVNRSTPFVLGLHALTSKPDR